MRRFTIAVAIYAFLCLLGMGIILIRGEGPNWAPPDDVRPVVEFTRKGLGME